MPPDPTARHRPPPRVALVHDWLTGMRGGEKVLETLCGLYPGAAVFTLLHVRGSVSARIEACRPRHTWIGRLPGVAGYYRTLLPLFPAAIETLDLDGFDLVISTSHCAAKSAVVPGRARHLCYCFTPMRYAWDQFDAYFSANRMGAGARVLRPVLRGLAGWDRATSGRPHRYVAISQYVAARIGRYYNRQSAIVYPPVDTAYFTPSPGPPGKHVLVVSALVPYKRIDVAIDACRRAGRPLRVVGDGPERDRLERLAGPDVRFLGRLPDEAVREEYRRAAAVVLPAEEDFGIVPVEAQACGRPVVALARGGSRETVVDGETGVLVPECTPEAFADGLDRLANLDLSPAAMRRHAERFATERFVAEFSAEVDALLDAPEGAARW
jgi:glycosyltransferase involved in cell wall biosynthesis